MNPNARVLCTVPGCASLIIKEFLTKERSVALKPCVRDDHKRSYLVSLDFNSLPKPWYDYLGRRSCSKEGGLRNFSKGIQKKTMEKSNLGAWPCPDK